MVYSDRTVVDLLHKNIRSWLSSFFKSISIFTYIVCMLLWENLTLCRVSTIHSPVSCQLITTHFSSILIVICQFFTWIVLHDVDLCFSFMLVRKANAVEEETMWAVWLYYYHNPYASLMVWWWPCFLLASSTRQELYRVKLKSMGYCVCPVTLNWILLCKFMKWFKFSSHIKVKLCKKKLHKMIPVCV